MVAKAYRVARLQGGYDELRAHLGHVVLLDLWASWCEPCRVELPELDKLARGDRDLVVLAANQGESEAVVRASAGKLGLHMPILLDHEQSYGGAYATVGLPTAVIVDRKGRVARVVVGAHSASDWRGMLAEVAAR